MDSIEIYNSLKTKHNEQEELLKEDVTEKLTKVDIGQLADFNVNKKVQIDDVDKRVSAKSAFMRAYSEEYVNRLADLDAKHISEKGNIKKVISLSLKTKENADNLATIHQYSLNNRERNEKTRNTHREKVNDYANNLIVSSKKHMEAITNYEALANRGELTRGEKKILKKEFLKKYKLDLEVIEQEYQMNKHLIKMGGKKDISEEDSLFRLKYTRYAKAIAANNKAIEMARKYPDLFDAADFQKQIDKIRKKLNSLGDTASNELMESKRDYFVASFHTRRARLTERRGIEEERRKIDKIKEKYGVKLQNAINSYIEKKAQNGSENEVAWISEQLSLDALAKELTAGKGMEILFSKNRTKPGTGETFFKNFDQAMDLFIDRFLFDNATKLSTDDSRGLRDGGIPAETLDRSVRSQLHPVRKLNNGEYVSKEDEENDNFNRKYINSLLNNDMKARRECIEENFKILYSYNYDMKYFKNPDYFFEDSWKRFMLLKMSVGSYNLTADNYSATATINNNKEIAREVRERWFAEKGSVEVNGQTMTYGDFISKLFFVYEMMTKVHYNVAPGSGILEFDITAEAPETRGVYVRDLEAFVAGYKELHKNDKKQE